MSWGSNLDFDPQGPTTFAHDSSASRVYFVKFSPPTLQGPQIPNELPLPTMFVHRLVMLAGSAKLIALIRNGVSVTANEPTVAAVWIVVP